MKKLLICSLAMVLLLFGTAAAKADTGKELAADADNAVYTGETFHVILTENASTNYAWNYVIEGDNIEKLGELVEVPKPMVEGASTYHTWTFRAKKAGNATLRFTYARAFEPTQPPAATHLYTVTVSDPEKVYSARLNRRFTVTLTENPSTGYSWMPVTGDAFVLVGTKTIEPSSNTGMVGAPVKKVFTLKATQKGLHVLRFIYARPWESTQPADTAAYVFQVK